MLAWASNRSSSSRLQLPRKLQDIGRKMAKKKLLAAFSFQTKTKVVLLPSNATDSATTAATTSSSLSFGP